MKAILAEGIRRVRPAPLAAAIARITGLNKREIVNTKHGTFFVNPLTNLGFHLLRGEYEPSTTAILCEYLTPGCVFVDLGANEGYFSVLASRLVGPKGRVIAIEPQSRLQRLIEANLKANNCENVQLVKAAVSSKTEKVYLELTSDMNTGATSLFGRTKYPLPREEVQSTSLGDLFDAIGLHRCDLMKVDIEGAEYDALTGAEDVLKRGIIRHMTVEVHASILARRGLSWSQTDQVILACGYRFMDKGGATVYSFAG